MRLVNERTGAAGSALVGMSVEALVDTGRRTTGGLSDESGEEEADFGVS